MAEKFHAYISEARDLLENSLPPLPFHRYFSFFGYSNKDVNEEYF